MSQSFILLIIELGARVKVSPARMRREYLAAGAVLAVARLRDELVGHAAAVVHKDDDEGFKGDFKGLCRTNHQRRSDVDNSTRCTITIIVERDMHQPFFVFLLLYVILLSSALHPRILTESLH